jgi:hypothetical protein
MTIGISEQERERLIRLGETVLGPQWTSRLARALGTNPRTAQRWASGKRPVNPVAFEFLEEQAPGAKRARASIQSIIESVEADKADPMVLIAALEDAAANIRARHDLDVDEKSTDH